MRRITIILLAASLALSGQTNRKMQSRPQIGTTSATGPHQAIVNWSNPNCTTNAQCTLQVYRATCTSITSCPAYSPGSGSWKALDMTSNLTVSPGLNGTTWQYLDKDPALQDSTTYSWVATNSYVGATTASGASTAYNGTTNNGTPIAPTLSTNGNSVN
jgi:hypothetical protein